mgnify:CR=1 FL=1
MRDRIVPMACDSMQLRIVFMTEKPGHFLDRDQTRIEWAADTLSVISKKEGLIVKIIPCIVLATGLAGSFSAMAIHSDGIVFASDVQSFLNRPSLRLFRPVAPRRLPTEAFA